MVIDRLAVDKDYQGKKIGPGLLRDVTLRTLQAADIAGIRAILVHAISERRGSSMRCVGSLPRRWTR